MSNLRKKKKKGFTLVETILVMTAFFLLMVIIIGMYTKMIKLKYGIQARQELIQNSYYIFERLNLLVKDYTIDYEEYFNRKHVGCDNKTIGDGSDFSREDTNKDGHCTINSFYGNKNTLDTSSSDKIHKLYYCSSSSSETQPEYVINNINLLTQYNGCNYTNLSSNPYYQSYGQYKNQFWDVKNDVDFNTGSVNDSDDEDLGRGPVSIADNQNVKEIYLISQDKTKRILLRRKYITGLDVNGDGIISGDIEKRYNMQILKLRGFDAGSKHDFNQVDKQTYDGQIDTRACDRSQGFICHGTPINGVYSGYNIPLDNDDGRVDMFEKNLTISDRNIQIYPNKNPDYSWNEDNIQINPYFTLAITSKLYGDVWRRRLSTKSLENFQLSIQTTFNTKNFYTK